MAYIQIEYISTAEIYHTKKKDKDHTTFHEKISRGYVERNQLVQRR